MSTQPIASGQTQRTIPRALFSCHFCEEEYSWPAEDIAWSEKLSKWVCSQCWSDENAGETGIKLVDEIAKQASELTAALRRITELEKDNLELMHQRDDVGQKATELEAQAQGLRDERDERSLLALERWFKLDDLTADLETCRANFTIQANATTTIGEELKRVETDRDELLQRLDIIAATMFPVTLRHPQLLDPPSRCPRCGNKSWERYTPDDVEPEYRCLTCRYPQPAQDDTARLDRIEAGLIVGQTEHGWYAGMPGTTAYDARTLRDAIDGATQP